MKVKIPENLWSQSVNFIDNTQPNLHHFDIVF
jgi:hypothetical protein